MKSEAEFTGDDLIERPGSDLIVSNYEKITGRTRAQHHPALRVTSDYLLLVKRVDARQDEEPDYVLDLKKYWLPANSVYSEPIPLVSRPGYIKAIIEVIDSYLYRVEPSKSRHTRAAFILSSVVKFFEFMWLKDVFEFESINEELFDSLFEDLVAGGWHKALGISDRLDSMLYGLTERDRDIPLFTGRYQHSSVRASEIQRLLGTNIDAREVAAYFRKIKLFQFEKGWISKLPKSAVDGYRKPSGYGYSILRQTLESINLLFMTSSGLKIYPYPEYAKRAKRATAPQGRTANISPVVASRLLSYSFLWVYDCSDLVVELLADMRNAVVRASREGLLQLGSYLPEAVLRSNSRLKLEKLLGVKIEGTDNGSKTTLSVREVITCLQSACFVVIATLNARRRDEVEHRKLGIHFGCCAELDRDLELYELVIYVEKSLRDYDRFFVGQSTYLAINALEQLQLEYIECDRVLGRCNWDSVPERERTLFSYRRMSKAAGFGAKQCWYTFDAGKDGLARKFLGMALSGDIESLPLRPHMFRRLYCLIYMYRYELPDIRYLSRQLRHSDLIQTVTYVTDPEAVSDKNSISTLFSSRGASDAVRDHVKNIEIEMREVADEKLAEIIFSILSGENYSGGFSRFVRSIYKKFIKNVDFSLLSIEAKSKNITDRLKRKGYHPEPFSHGNCMAGSARSQLIAACRASDGTGPQKGRASPKLCSQCSLHCTNQNFIESLKLDLDDMESRLLMMPTDTIESQVLRSEISNLIYVIAYHEAGFHAGKLN